MELFSDTMQNVKSAAEFYESKVKDLAGNITDLESIIQNKSSSLRAVEEGKAGTLSRKPCSYSNLCWQSSSKRSSHNHSSLHHEACSRMRDKGDD